MSLEMEVGLRKETGDEKCCLFSFGLSCKKLKFGMRKIYFVLN